MDSKPTCHRPTMDASSYTTRHRRKLVAARHHLGFLLGLRTRSPRQRGLVVEWRPVKTDGSKNGRALRGTQRRAPGDAGGGIAAPFAAAIGGLAGSQPGLGAPLACGGQRYAALVPGSALKHQNLPTPRRGLGGPDGAGSRATQGCQLGSDLGIPLDEAAIVVGTQ